MQWHSQDSMVSINNLSYTAIIKKKQFFFQTITIKDCRLQSKKGKKLENCVVIFV